MGSIFSILPQTLELSRGIILYIQSSHQKVRIRLNLWIQFRSILKRAMTKIGDRIRVYEVSYLSKKYKTLEGVYEHTKDVNGEPFYAKVNTENVNPLIWENMNLYCFVSGPYFGYFVFSPESKARSDGFPCGNSFPDSRARLRTDWNGKVKIPVIALWENYKNKKVIGINYDQSEFNDKFQEMVDIYAANIKSVRML